MSTYVEYELDDGTILLIEAYETIEGVVKAAVGTDTVRVGRRFAEALDSVKKSAKLLREKLEDMQADEVEVKFGLKATGEVGNNLFAIGKVGTEVNYEVTLKWNNSGKKAN